MIYDLLSFEILVSKFELWKLSCGKRTLLRYTTASKHLPKL